MSDKYFEYSNAVLIAILGISQLFIIDLMEISSVGADWSLNGLSSPEQWKYAAKSQDHNILTLKYWDFKSLIRI